MVQKKMHDQTIVLGSYLLHQTTFVVSMLYIHAVLSFLKMQEEFSKMCPVNLTAPCIEHTFFFLKHKKVSSCCISYVRPCCELICDLNELLLNHSKM
jgi:hypothetical protein